MADGEYDPIFICSALPMKSLLFAPYSSFQVLLHKRRHSASGTVRVTIVNGEEQRVSQCFWKQMERKMAWQLSATKPLLMSISKELPHKSEA